MKVPREAGIPAIKGELTKGSVMDVCQLIATGQKSGILTVKQPYARARVHFEMGRVQFAHLVPGVHLGEVLVRMNLLTVQEVQRAARCEGYEGDINSSSLGLNALRLRLLDDAELQRALAAQMIEVFIELITWKSCTFSFEERSLLASQVLTTDSTDIMQLFMEITGRLGDWTTERVSEKAVFDKASDPTKLGLSEWDWEVLGYVDGSRSAASIAAEVELPERQVYHLLYKLEKAGAVRPDEAEAQPPSVLLFSADNLTGRLMRLALRRVALKTYFVQSTSPERGLVAVQERRPKALVLYDGGDAKGGAASAWPLVRALRQHPGLKHLPAVVLSGDDNGFMQRLRRPKATVLENPFTELELQQTVMRLLGRSL